MKVKNIIYHLVLLRGYVKLQVHLVYYKNIEKNAIFRTSKQLIEMLQ